MFLEGLKNITINEADNGFVLRINEPPSKDAFDKFPEMMAKMQEAGKASNLGLEDGPPLPRSTGVFIFSELSDVIKFLESYYK